MCLFYDEPERVGLFEIWSSHKFVLETCCENLYETVGNEMAQDRESARSLLRRIGVEEVMGQPLWRLADDGGCGLVLHWQLRVCKVGFEIASHFVGVCHRHCRPLTAGGSEQAFSMGGRRSARSSSATRLRRPSTAAARWR